jgi:histidinol dehydrogenase
VTFMRRGTIQELGQTLLRDRTQESTVDPGLASQVKQIVDRVRVNGDRALLEYTMLYDGEDLTSKGIRVAEEDVAAARSKVNSKDVRALRYLQERIARIEKKRLKAANFVYKDGFITLRQVTLPLSSVGCYVPGGRAAYPSTVLMTVVPAKVAGVPRVIVCSPPSKDGEIDPLVLVAADLSGVDEIYRVGGAQAIASMAYGTETIRRVDKIVGPASQFVTEAKRMVSSVVSIDLPAGPSEIVILADSTADPHILALDLISEAEHAPDNVSVLVTTSKTVLEQTLRLIEERLDGLERREIITEAFNSHGALLLASSVDEALEFVNSFAPEHLEIIADDPRGLADKITSAGMILLGDYTPAAASDYCLGTNHVLPTRGSARTFSGLSVLDYVKTVPIVECGKPALKQMLRQAETLSQREGLPNHYLALVERFSND